MNIRIYLENEPDTIKFLIENVSYIPRIGETVMAGSWVPEKLIVKNVVWHVYGDNKDYLRDYVDLIVEIVESAY